MTTNGKGFPNMWFVLFLIALYPAGSAVAAQIHFDSGSTGVDGALIFEEPESATTIVFDPTAYDPPLDSDGDNIYHFTTIYIPRNLTLKLTDEKLGSLPVIWLAQGAVQIGGKIDLNAGDPYGDGRFPPVAGAGGFRGGRPEMPGCGPGAGQVAADGAGALSNGAGAGHAYQGGANHAEVEAGTENTTGGRAYGNMFLMPMMGGSGGAGGRSAEGFNDLPGGGGSGGGAILIASSVSIYFIPNNDISSFWGAGIYANGGKAGMAGYKYQTNFSGGTGSGGAIRLVAPEITGNGELRAVGGEGGGWVGVGASVGSVGRIRLECYEHNRHLLSFGSIPDYTWGSPLRVFPPDTAPKVRVTSIDGVAVPELSRGLYLRPDVEISASTVSTVLIEANYVPVGTEIELTIQPEYESQIKVTTTALEGTLEKSTAQAQVQFPPGFSRGYVFANWQP